MGENRERIVYGIHHTRMGEMILAQSKKGLVWLGFMVPGYKGNGLERLKKHLPDGELVRDDAGTHALKQAVLDAWECGRMDTIELDLRGTSFQKRVWAALLEIPKGEVRSYGQLAASIGRPMAARAVGTAVGENPVSLIVPCHRIVQSDGSIGNYGWGVEIKRNLLLEEEARVAA